MKHYSQISFGYMHWQSLLTSLSLHYAINRLYISSFEASKRSIPSHSILTSKF
jgi:hypothetical protein